MNNSSMYDIIRHPVITEKTTIMSEQGKYVFDVLSSANKTSIKGAVEAIFGVKVSKVNILNVKGKVKRFKGILGVRQGYKKAIITVLDGQVIDFSGGVK
jgi:large subunit ribosomal protein L23